jgi:hypothetical protein
MVFGDAQRQRSLKSCFEKAEWWWVRVTKFTDVEEEKEYIYNEVSASACTRP